jgi:hypothetical protein
MHVRITGVPMDLGGDRSGIVSEAYAHCYAELIERTTPIFPHGSAHIKVPQLDSQIVEYLRVCSWKNRIQA